MTEKKGNYDFTAIEKKWQQYWEINKTFAAVDLSDKPKYYVLDMFPYPSANGLHVGHPEGYTASDIVARYKRMKGFNVLHPMGWDAFGLPAEQYAIQTGTDPATTTQNNVDNIRKQIKSLGFSYDWNREVNTTDPNYYKWTQWIFLKLFNSYFDETEQKAKPIEQLVIPEKLSEQEKREYIDSHRLAYEAEVAVNWCPELGTVLANEEIVGGVSERGGHPVFKKPMRQWMLRITRYAERLIDDLELVDWPESIKKLQTDWVGKSIGAEVDFKLDGYDEVIRVFTTRPDTLYGATYMVLAPEYKLVDLITTDENKSAVQAYRDQASLKSDLDRTDLAKEKTGVFTGAYAINPVNDEKIPIWISDYVLISYGTGAIMAVPAHDDRDFEFADKFNIKIKPVVKPLEVDVEYELAWSDYSDTMSEQEWNREKASLIKKYINEVLTGKRCWPGKGIAINSGEFDKLRTDDFKLEITKKLEKDGNGCKAINYKLRDWLFSRQRYWGEPFPILHAEDGAVIGLTEADLPLTLPIVESYKPTGTGEPPLSNAGDWLDVTLPDGTRARRETNTMPQWAGSCWYYLRYIDPHNHEAGWDPDKEKYWMNVDLYIGGAEHAVLHLLYARFWHKVLYDLGYVSTKEPFQKLINQGMILGLSYKDSRGALVANDLVANRDGKFFHKETSEELEEFSAKMSKSLRNVVNPDDVISRYGADSMRLYEMFMGPLEATKPWSMQGVEGVYRFLQRAWRMVIDTETGQLSPSIQDVPGDEETLRILHRTVKKVGDDIETFGFNTAISAMMIFVNHMIKLDVRPKDAIEKFVMLLAPFAPHIAEELWQKLGHNESLAYDNWPDYDEQLIKASQVELAVQVMGKIRDKIVVSADADENQIREKALASERVRASMGDKEPKKVIVIKSRLVNIVV